MESRTPGRVHLLRAARHVKCINPRRLKVLWEELEGGVGFQDGRACSKEALREAHTQGWRNWPSTLPLLTPELSLSRGKGDGAQAGPCPLPESTHVPVPVVAAQQCDTLGKGCTCMQAELMGCQQSLLWGGNDPDPQGALPTPLYFRVVYKRLAGLQPPAGEATLNRTEKKKKKKKRQQEGAQETPVCGCRWLIPDGWGCGQAGSSQHIGTAMFSL